MPTALETLTPALQSRLAAVRLVACDVDGTLLTSTHQVTERTVEAVAAAQASGIEVMLASSRAPGALRPVLHALEPARPAAHPRAGDANVKAAASPPFISSQGALLGRYFDGELQHSVTDPHRWTPHTRSWLRRRRSG